MKYTMFNLSAQPHECDAHDWPNNELPPRFKAAALQSTPANICQKCYRRFCALWPKAADELFRDMIKNQKPKDKRNA